MKLLALSALLCAVMALTFAADAPEVKAPPAPGEETNLVKRHWHCHCHCYHGWMRFKHRYYKYFPTPKTWAQAEKTCQSVGGNLASVHNLCEYRAIQRLIQVWSHAQKEAWIGGYDATEEGTWLWSDGTRFTYSNWCRGEPNNGLGTKQHCVQMNYTRSKCWDDNWCNQRRPFVCAKKRR